TPQNDETAARQLDCRPRPQGEDAIPTQLVSPVPAASDPPRAALAVHGTEIALHRSATAFQGVPPHDDRDERQQSEGEQREERPFGDVEPRSDVQLLPQESPPHTREAPSHVRAGATAGPVRRPPQPWRPAAGPAPERHAPAS